MCAPCRKLRCRRPIASQRAVIPREPCACDHTRSHLQQCERGASSFHSHTRTPHGTRRLGRNGVASTEGVDVQAQGLPPPDQACPNEGETVCFLRTARLDHMPASRLVHTLWAACESCVGAQATTSEEATRDAGYDAAHQRFADLDRCVTVRVRSPCVCFSPRLLCFHSLRQWLSSA